MSLCFGSKHKVSYYPVFIEPNGIMYMYVHMKIKFPFLFYCSDYNGKAAVPGCIHDPDEQVLC